MCFACGREFSKGSLEIHFYQCAKKAEIETNRIIETPNEYLIFFEKIKTSQKISYSEIEDFNNFSNMLFKSKTMAACPYCNRRFLKDRLEVHLRSCKPKDGNLISNNANVNNNKRNSRMLDCNTIKNLYNARSVDKLNQNANNAVSDNLNINKSGDNINFKNIKILKDVNKENNLKNNNTNKNLPDSKDEICLNCEVKVNLSKLPIHLKKCPGKKRNSSHNKFAHGSNTKFNPQSSFTGDSTSDFAKNNNNKLNPNATSKPKFLSSEKKPEVSKESKNKTFGASGAENQKPCFLVCYLCGREFGTKSLEIHLKTCKIKFLNSEDIGNSSTIAATNFKKTNKNTNIPEPPNILYELLDKINTNQHIAFQEISEYNNLAEKIYKEKSLKQCIGCKRSFIKESLEVHLKSCKLAQKAQESEPVHMKMTQRPRMLICPLCGREFGSLSLDIHIKTCRNKFDLEQENMPRNLRRSADVILNKYYTNLNKKEEHINKSNGGGAKSGYQIEQLNNDAYEIFTKEALVPCENCGRTFLPDRLLVHMRSCKVKMESKVNERK
jgi:uncharacterized Zn-finger protein